MAAIHPRAIIRMDLSTISSSSSSSDHPSAAEQHRSAANVIAAVDHPIDNHHHDWFNYVLDDNASDHCSHHSYSHRPINNHHNPVCSTTCNNNNHQYYWYRCLRQLYQGVRYLAASNNDERTSIWIPIIVLFVAIVCALTIGVCVGFIWGKRQRCPVVIPNKTSTKMKKKKKSWISRMFDTKQQQRLQEHPQQVRIDDADEEEENAVNNLARVSLTSSDEMERESGVLESELPQHVAVIMDGNRRYGEYRYGSRLRGHSDGSRTLLSFAKWCLAEHIPQLTVYALSTENWARHPAEIQHLMDIIQTHCQELRTEAIQRSIRVCIISTNEHAIPQHVRSALEELQRDTQHGQRLRLNICLSYGGRGEIVAACQNILNHHHHQQQHNGSLNSNSIQDNRHPPKPIIVTEQMIEQSLQLPSSPDVLIRTSNEYRLSNFLLWQLAYTELFFLDKYWPQVEKQDLLDVLREFAKRQRRYGK